MNSQIRTATPVRLAPNQSQDHPAITRKNAPPKSGIATAVTFWVAVSPNVSEIRTPNAPIKSHTMKLIVRCNQAPINVGQCPLFRAARK